MADMRHVDADLMGAAGFQVAFDQRGERRRVRLLVEAFEHLVVGDRLVGRLRAGALDGAARAVAGARPSGASTVPVSERGRPQTMA
jgi:hypothetical protein